MSAKKIGRFISPSIVLAVLIAGGLAVASGLPAIHLPQSSAGLIQAASAASPKDSVVFGSSVHTGSSSGNSGDSAPGRLDDAYQGDSDGDGLSNADEYANFTDPNNPDTDGDGITDLDEIENGSDPTDATNSGIATVSASAVSGSDVDGDSLPDEWETQYGLNPNQPSGDDGASGDPDGDQLINIDEWANGTDPKAVDTDGDTLPDQWEVENSLNPTDPAGANGAQGDPDDDGLTNEQERTFHTEPFDADTDADSLPDQWELAFGLDPLDSTAGNGAKGDPDNDDYANASEYRNFTNPVKPDSPVDDDDDGSTMLRVFVPQVAK